MEALLVNVVAKRCLHSECKTQPSFAYKGEKPKFCVKHKSLDMIDVRTRKSNDQQLSTMIDVKNKKCAHSDCNYGGKPPEYCKLHKQNAMINVRYKRCLHPGCDVRPLFGKKGETASYCEMK